MTDLERLNDLRVRHYGDGIYACRRCRTLPAEGACDTQYAMWVALGLLYRVAELESLIPASADPPSESDTPSRR